MNIGLLTTFPNPNDSNSSTSQYRYLTKLVKLLSESRDIDDITLYSIDKHKWSVSLSPSAQVVPIRSTNILVRWLKMLNRLIKDRHGIDLFIAYNPCLATSPVILLNKLYRKPVIIEYMDNQSTASEGQHWALRFLNVLIESLALRTVDNWLTSSTYHETKIKECRKRASVLVYRGAFLEEDDAGGEEIELPLTLPPDCVKIAYMGGLHYNRGVDILIKAFSQLSLQQACLYVTGVGPFRPELERLVEEKQLQNIPM